ncbi:hypothetical protein SAMN03080615_02252 [Amphritea atlantica]|uniref:DUF4129 domain-containing protein n=1 Tax=Amphritea atlantica TaxID=355243 RepID=A0A1H9HVV1_9GAMM|nr:hypothetical protein [Amphritea atlantica]SEQ66408.1 hypothetical protein SAMN03080615_02252 [Amphritea atlantica]
MELDKLEISLRRRTPWEAIDLGFALARRWFKPLWLLWLSTAVPLGLLLFLFLSDELGWLMLIIWWFKPLYEPPLMFWLSRAVFGEQLPVKTVLRQWWSVVRPQLLLNLTLRRFNPSRSFTLPVALLEQLKGSARRDRLRVLGRNQSAAAWLTVIGIHLETVLEMAFITVVFMLIPEDLRWTSFGDLFMAPGRVGDWLQFAGGLLCMSVIAPFYVAAGFTLYLNRRSELEAWDIEINFRRTSERFKSGASRRSVSTVAAVMLAAVLALAVPLISTPVDAAQQVSARDAKPLIEKVLEDEAFGRYEQTHYWKYTGQPEPDSDSDNWFIELLAKLFNGVGDVMQGGASIGKILVWIAGIALVVFLIYQVAKNSQWFRNFQRRPARKGRSRPVELFGLDLRPDQLPDDPAGEARKLIAEGAFREALSLLYRGALVYLVTQEHIEIPDSATEGECEQLVIDHRSASEADFFKSLTSHWLRMAYGHVVPAEAPVVELCQRWQEVYGHVER